MFFYCLCALKYVLGIFDIRRPSIYVIDWVDDLTMSNEITDSSDVPGKEIYWIKMQVQYQHSCYERFCPMLERLICNRAIVCLFYADVEVATQRIYSISKERR